MNGTRMSEQLSVAVIGAGMAGRTHATAENLRAAVSKL